MTKVGVYAIIRVVTLIFGENAGAAAWAPMPWILPCALLTMVIGFVGLLGSRALRRIAAFGVIGSTGTLLAAISVFEPRALAAGLYYLPHTTLAGALLFLTTDLIVRRRPSHGDAATARRSEEHTSELQSLMRISYAVFCLKKKNKNINKQVTR